MAWRAPPPAADFEEWKPKVCEHPECDAPHPSFSRHGRAGPWLCKLHYDASVRIAASSEAEKMNTPTQQRGLFE